MSQSEASTAHQTPDVNQINKSDVNKAYKEFEKEITDYKFRHIKQRVLKQDQQLDRLTNEKFRNPYDVLYLDMSATDEEIKKQYKVFSLLLHPDKCKDPRAQDCFYVVERAYKTLQDPEKRKIYLRLMNIAKERTAYERDEENRKRKKKGLSELPEDYMESRYEENLKKIFDELEEKKIHHAKLQESEKMQKQEEMEIKQHMEQYRIYTEDEWEQTRENRVNNWRNFNKKKSVVGTKKSDKGIRAPQYKQEERPDYAPKIDNTGKIVGINEDYKKKWK